jgi:D-serine deaminase-like pyridoxal phosphate-dependent protein
MKITDLDTPAVVVDLAILEANLARAQAHADALGLRLRPHVKTHKLPRVAQMQMALGAVGITCQKLGEAEAMADAGLADIFLPYNILGAAKRARLAALAGRVALSVTADSAETVAGYAETFADPARPLSVLIECDTGAGRCGVQSPAEAVALAGCIAAAPGLRFAGLMTYPPQGRPAEVDRWLAGAAAALAAAGLPAGIISTGGTPDLYRLTARGVATEYRPGTYAYGDRMQVGWGHGAFERCALSVLATVVSRPTPDRAILDTGSKALAADAVAAGGFGHLPAFPEARIVGLSEEHATVDLSACGAARPAIGARLAVIPNHACVVSNLHDIVHLARGQDVVAIDHVTSRGRLQ